MVAVKKADRVGRINRWLELWRVGEKVGMPEFNAMQ